LKYISKELSIIKAKSAAESDTQGGDNKRKRRKK
jgi:hypothetical protein